MKFAILTISALLAFNTFAKDMSRDEDYKVAYRDLEDGSREYIGGCSVHQDYEGKLFTVGKTIVETYEPGYEAPKKETLKRIKHVEIELLKKTAEGSDGDYVDFFANVDDFTLEKISSKKFKRLDLYRWNIGVGGGNGYYEVYNRTIVNGKPHYEKLSNVFDGDVEFCDSKVWIIK